MDWGEFSAGDGRPSPRKELQIQGPRPTPLKVRKDSHKIKKPPIAPPYHPQYHHQQQQIQPQQYQNQNQYQQQQQQRQPVIIYTVSPKVIHTDASEFMSLVQRLTGPNSSSSPTVSNSNSGAISPAARYATIEKTKMPSEARFFDSMDTIIGDIEIGPHVERTGTFPGILSPMPSSLPIVSPNFFSPPSDQNSFNFLHDLSPLFQGNKNYFETAFMPSPNNSSFLATPTALTSPNLSFDLFNQFLDF